MEKALNARFVSPIKGLSMADGVHLEKSEANAKTAETKSRLGPIELGRS